MSYHLRHQVSAIHHGSFSHPLVLAALTYLSAKDVFFVGSSFIKFYLMLSITRPSSAVLPWIEDCSFGASTLIPAVLLLILVVSLYLFSESAH